MNRKKISVTVDPGRMSEALRLAGDDNLSAVVDRALEAFVDRERERIWLEAHPPEDLPGPVTPDFFDLPWDEDAPR